MERDWVDKKFHPDKADRLISKERFERLRPDLLLKKIGLENGMTIADIGCGNGFFTLPAAELVVPDGVVYALDVSQAMLDKLREQALPANVRVILCEELSFPLENNSIDLVILSAVFHEIADRETFLQEMKRILKDNGELWILEWVPREEQHGPPKNHRISREELETVLLEQDFRIDWQESVGDSHYQLLSRLSHQTDDI